MSGENEQIPGSEGYENCACMEGKKEEKKSGCWKWALGCGIFALLIIAGLCVVSYLFYSRIESDMDSAERNYVTEGYELVKQDVIDISEPVNTKKVFSAKVVKLSGGASADIAIVGMTCVIGGNYPGKVSFSGVQLVLEPGSEIGTLEGKGIQLIGSGKIRENKAEFMQSVVTPVEVESAQSSEKE